MRSRPLVAVAVVFLCVTAAHVWLIWMAPTALSFSVEHVHTDNAVILMMAKHMLEKGEFPIFYYGQDWFGSLSAIVHAAIFHVLGGIPPWSIHVAPLLFFLGFCLALYALARDTLGRAVALLALGWNITTPLRLSEYSVMPHGGYVEALMLGTVLLWLSVRLVGTEGSRRKHRYYALLGLAGGVAWWTSPLVVYHVLASSLYVVLRERAAALRNGVLLSVPAFLLGAAPFFYYYAVDPHSSVLSLGGGYALSHVPTGLWLLFAERLPQYLDWDLFGSRLSFAPALAALSYAWATLFTLWHLRQSFRADHPRRHAAIFPIFFLSFVLLLAASSHIRRAAPQYVLPLSTFFPVAMGFWLVHSRLVWQRLAWSAAAAVLLLHGWATTSWVVTQAPRAELLTARHLQLIEGIEATGVTRLYVPARPGSELLNFYARERMIASQMMAERYAPNLHALEREAQPGFLVHRDTDQLAATLKVLRASYEAAPLGSYDLIHHVRALERRYRQIPPLGLRASASHESRTMPHALDRDMDSFWTSVRLKTPGMWVEFDLGRPVHVGMVRLWNRGLHHGNYAMDARVETSVHGDVWHEVVPRSPTAYFYWSGPRLYPWEWDYRWEARFASVQARFLRITQYEEDRRAPWMIAEAYVYEDLGPRVPGPEDEQAVLRRIHGLGLTRVYADRWMSAKISEASQGTIETVTPFTVPISAFYPRLKSRVVRWSPATGFVLEDSDADEFERLLKQEGVHRLTREAFGRWVLFHSTAAGPPPGASPGVPGWWWTGLGIVKTAH